MTAGRARVPKKSKLVGSFAEAVVGIPDGATIAIGGFAAPGTPYNLIRALLPLGGPGEGYKGTGLAVIGEILCGVLTGLGFGVEPTGRHNDGCFLLAIKVDAFRPLAEFRAEVAGFAAYLKDTPPSEGSRGVLYPGEMEHAKKAERKRDGVNIEDSTWGKLGDLAEAVGLSAQLGFA